MMIMADDKKRFRGVKRTYEVLREIDAENGDFLLHIHFAFVGQMQRYQVRYESIEDLNIAFEAIDLEMCEYLFEEFKISLN